MAIGVEAVNVCVAVAVGGVKVPVGGDRQVGRHVERLPTVPGRAVQGRPHCEQEFPLLGPPSHSMVSRVAGVHGAVRSHANAVRDLEVVAILWPSPNPTPAIQVVPIFVENHDGGVGPAIEDVDVVILVHGHVGTVHEGPTLWTLEETLHGRILVIATAESNHPDIPARYGPGSFKHSLPNGLFQQRELPYDRGIEPTPQKAVKNSADPHKRGRPMSTALAPSTSALSTSMPRRTPESN